MTYCEVCKKEIGNDEWREHKISENHLNIEKMDYCKVCKENYHVSVYGDQYPSYQDRCRSAQENHICGSVHKENQARYDLYFA